MTNDKPATNFQRDKDWWLEKAKQEAGYTIGAGVPTERGRHR